MKKEAALSEERKMRGYFIRRMSLADLPQVIEIERASFPSPWPSTLFEQELKYNQMVHYFVACRGEESRKTSAEVLGYVGLRILAGEAHLTTIAVKESKRRRGVGESLLIWAIEFAQCLGASLLSLEVRTSNLPAQSLYRKYGFVQVGIRRHYYGDTGEDALLMNLEDLTSPSLQTRLRQLKQSVARKSSALI